MHEHECGYEEFMHEHGNAKTQRRKGAKERKFFRSEGKFFSLFLCVFVSLRLCVSVFMHRIYVSAPVRLREKRPIVLLEVLIAFALVVLCALPLIYPHMAIFKAEKKFIDTIELDHVVNLLYANRLEKLYLREIPWADIDGGKELTIDSQMIQESGWKRELPFNGHYKFLRKAYKPHKAPEEAVYLFKLIFAFTSKDKDSRPFAYEYEIVIERQPT